MAAPRADLKVSEILLAAAELLWSGEEGTTFHQNVNPMFSCQAIALVLGLDWDEIGDRDQVEAHPAVQFLYELGMPDSGGFLHWSEGGNGCPLPYSIRMELRYAWLQLAAQVAAEESR